ncbi:MAG: hypothetical protein GY820_23140 [Gammaproteobacteria bacterium]|nr:hypothetical protein [Gammaproteobacteria bacterium]
MNNSKTTSLVPHIAFGMFILEILFLFIKKIDGTIYGVFDAIEKLYPIIAILLLTAFMKPKLNHQWWIALGFYSLYLLYGILISLAHHKGIKIIFVQFYHELKFFPMMLLFAMVQCNERWSIRTMRVIKPIIIITILLIFFQLAAPGLYDTIFKNGGHFEKGHIAGMSIPRLVGWFWHPSQIALFFLISTVFFFVEHNRGNIKLLFTMIVVSFLFVFISIQRFELLVMFIVLITFWICRYIEIDYRPYLASIIFLFFSGGILYIISDEANFWWLIDNVKSPRIIFLVEALFSLVESNYWGAGWGTIGSHAAADVANVYDYNAMKDLWWIKLGQYFYDTYWPHVIGETGLPGFFFLLFSMFFMIRALKRREASLLMFVLIMTSALSSNAQSLYHLTVFGWFIALIESSPSNENNQVNKQIPLPTTSNTIGVNS